MKEELIKAPIDNKNICEDFTFDFHNDLYIERISNKITHQVFYLYDCLCEISYRFGENWFKLRIIEGDFSNKERCNAHFKYVIKSFTHDNIKVLYNPFLEGYEFWFFVES